MFKYIVRAIKSPINKSVKYYAQAESTTPVGLDVITQRIEKRTTVSSADAKAVLDALEYEIKEALIEGHSVRLGDLGTFRATIQCSSGAATADDFTVARISHLKAVFRPSTRLANWLNPSKNSELKFQRVPYVAKMGPVEEE